jgi:hypothetical protein
MARPAEDSSAPKDEVLIVQRYNIEPRKINSAMLK